MVDDPRRLEPHAQRVLDQYATATSPSELDTERALRATLDAIDDRGTPSDRHRSRRWPWVAAAVLLLMGSGVAAASMHRGAPSVLVRVDTALSQAEDRLRPVEPIATSTVSHVPGTASAVAIPEPVPEPEPEPETEPESEPEPPKRHRARTKVTPEPEPEPAPTPVDVSTLAEERDLLARAQRAVTRGDFDRALTYCARHTARYPDGMLAPERLALQAIALCRSGDPTAGARTIETLRALTPGSPSIRRAEKACTP